MNIFDAVKVIYSYLWLLLLSPIDVCGNGSKGGISVLRCTMYLYWLPNKKHTFLNFFCSILLFFFSFNPACYISSVCHIPAVVYTLTHRSYPKVHKFRQCVLTNNCLQMEELGDQNWTTEISKLFYHFFFYQFNPCDVDYCVSQQPYVSCTANHF